MDGMASPSHSSGSFYNPLLISLVGIVSTSLAIAAYHLILVRLCLRWRRERRQLANRNLNQLPGGQSAIGVDQKVLATIPILSYSTNIIKGELFRVDQSECVVCLGELEEEDLVRLLPNCRHAFHVPCIDKWFSAHSNCPICRAPMAATTTIEKPLPIEVECIHAVRSSPDQFQGQGGDHGADDVSPSTLRSVRSGGLLRHCVSLVLPMEGKPRRMSTGLKRSFSMGQSFVVINIQGEREKAFSAASSSSSSPSSSIKDVPMQSRPYRARSVRHLDRMSSMLLRSFSQLRMGRGSSTASGILPY